MDRLLGSEWIVKYESEIGREAVKALISDVLNSYRNKIKNNSNVAFDEESVANEIRTLLE